jgi:hypothetical protein
MRAMLNAHPPHKRISIYHGLDGQPFSRHKYDCAMTFFMTARRRKESNRKKNQKQQQSVYVGLHAVFLKIDFFGFQ